ncbi:MAG: hypothetical protein IJU57_06825 [Clostridia bacterium]|nr:hypothetical protein [Clostridia bacterium]
MAELDRQDPRNGTAGAEYQKALDSAFPKPSPGFHDRVMAEVKAIREQDKKKRRLTASFARWGGIAACFVLLAAVIVTVVYRGGAENKAPADMVTPDYAVMEAPGDGGFSDELSFALNGKRDEPEETRSFSPDCDAYNGTTSTSSYGSLSDENETVEDSAAFNAVQTFSAEVPDTEMPLDILNSAILMQARNFKSFSTPEASSPSAFDTSPRECEEDTEDSSGNLENYAINMWANSSRVMNPHD